MPNAVRIALFVVLVCDALMVVILIGLKTVHRARVRRHDRRREQYVQLLSRHLAFDHAVDPIPAQAGEDEAFLDAIIDLRNLVTGAEVRKLAVIANRYELIDRQSKRLRSRFPLSRRLRAAVSLAELGNEASAATLMSHLDDPEPEIRIQAARGLARIGHTPAIDRIVDRLEVEDAWVRARFGDSLASFGSNASQPLMAYVRVNHQTGHTEAVVQALTTLGVIGDHGVGPQLADVLAETTNPEIQIAVVDALGWVGGSHVLDSVVGAMHSPDWRVRAKAATAIGMIGDSSAADELAHALQDQAWWVRRNSAGALAMMRDGVPLLYRALTSPDAFARDAAAEALEDIGELAKARAAHATGEASNDQLRLLRHMRSVSAVPA
jgi:HEAT repeat protein